MWFGFLVTIFFFSHGTSSYILQMTSFHILDLEKWCSERSLLHHLLPALESGLGQHPEGSVQPLNIEIES